LASKASVVAGGGEGEGSAVLKERPNWRQAATPWSSGVEVVVFVEHRVEVGIDTGNDGLQVVLHQGRCVPPNRGVRVLVGEGTVGPTLTELEGRSQREAAERLGLSLRRPR
jgi:hypothetical protein